jgi:hypothetical protein
VSGKGEVVNGGELGLKRKSMTSRLCLWGMGNGMWREKATCRKTSRLNDHRGGRAKRSEWMDRSKMIGLGRGSATGGQRYR